MLNVEIVYQIVAMNKLINQFEYHIKRHHYDISCLNILIMAYHETSYRFILDSR